VRGHGCGHTGYVIVIVIVIILG